MRQNFLKIGLRNRAFNNKILRQRTRTMGSNGNGEHNFNTIEEAVNSFRKGEIIIVVDDENREYEGDFMNAINDDLNFPEAVSIMRKMIKSDYPTHAKHKSLIYMDEVLGLGIGEITKAKLPTGAKQLLDERDDLRNAGKFKESDEIRNKLIKMGVEIEDTSKGSTWKIRNKDY